MSDKYIRTDRDRLEDIVAAAQDAIQFLRESSLDAFIQDDKLQSAVFWKIGIMGEATRQLSETFKEEHPNISWHRIAGMRNRIVHEYRQVDLEEVWRTVNKDLPKLIQQIDSLI